MIQDGVISAQYLDEWQSEEDQRVLSPALSFLSSGRRVDYQVWLSIGSTGWYERLEQPLTQPYVLSRQWPAGKNGPRKKKNGSASKSWTAFWTGR